MQSTLRLHPHDIPKPPLGVPISAASPCTPPCQEWLSERHGLTIQKETSSRRLRGLILSSCPHFADSGAEAFATPFLLSPRLRNPDEPLPNPTAFETLRTLVLDRCSLTDGAVQHIVSLIGQRLNHLCSFALTGNHLTLEPLSATLSAAAALGSSLGALPRLTDVDLSHNAISDAGGSEFCSALLAESAGVRALHLGATSVGNLTAAACASALNLEGASLTSLCLCGHVKLANMI